MKNRLWIITGTVEVMEGDTIHMYVDSSLQVGDKETLVGKCHIRLREQYPTAKIYIMTTQVTHMTLLRIIEGVEFNAGEWNVVLGILEEQK
jgi:hypothetical protein